VGKLFAGAVTVIALISTAVFVSHTWWLPPDLTALGLKIDSQIFETMIFTGTLFVAAQLAWRARGRK